MHKKWLLTAAFAVGLCAPAFAQTQQPTSESAFELPKLGRLTSDMTVTVKSKGGKYLIFATFKNLAQGELKVERIKEGATCTVKKDLLIHQDEDEPASPGNVSVRVWQVAAKDGACPFLTLFEMPKAAFDEAVAVIDREFPGEKPKQQ